MCPLWPAHLVLLYILMLWPIWFVCSDSIWSGKFYPDEVKNLVEDTSLEVMFAKANNSPLFIPASVEVIAEDCQIAEVGKQNQTMMFSNSSLLPQNLSFYLTGRFLGHTNVYLRASDKSGEMVAETAKLPVSIIRPKRVIDDIFVISVAVLVSLNYINMGCTIDLNVVKTTVKKPIAPAVGLVSQYLFMPLVSYALSFAIFESPNMRLGLFTVGCSPGGGASNMWTFLLGGNLNLSITMTFISNVLAFVMMPAWLFTLGRTVFEASNISIPYANIVTSLVAIVCPVGIGLLLQRYSPRLTAFCRRILGPCSIFMILFIVVFGIFTNLFMFSLFSWRVLVGGLCVPWLGYGFGALAAYLFRFPFEDILAIAVETGIQNTGIAIILLRFSLPQPDADLTSVLPVASAIMMPVPLLIILIILRLTGRHKKSKNYEICDEPSAVTEAGVQISETAIPKENSRTGLSNGNGQHY